MPEHLRHIRDIPGKPQELVEGRGIRRKGEPVRKAHTRMPAQGPSGAEQGSSGLNR
jgi:hypothetical protein